MAWKRYRIWTDAGIRWSWPLSTYGASSSYLNAAAVWRLEWRLAWASFVRIWSATKSSAHLVPPIWEMIILKHEWSMSGLKFGSLYVYLSIIQCRHNFWKKFGRCPETCLEADGRADFTMCFAAKVLSFIVLDATKPFFVSWAHANKAVVSWKLMGGRAWLDQPSTRCL